jgi:hypothetical protein
MGKLSKLLAKAEQLAKTELDKMLSDQGGSQQRQQQQQHQAYQPPVVYQQGAGAAGGVRPFSTPPPSPPPYSSGMSAPPQAHRPNTPPPAHQQVSCLCSIILSNQAVGHGLDQPVYKLMLQRNWFTLHQHDALYSAAAACRPFANPR